MTDTTQVSDISGTTLETTQKVTVPLFRQEHLQKFWEVAWGKDPFKELLKDLGGDDVEYLDFSKHIIGVTTICPTIPEDGKLCILEEYVKTFSTFEGDPDYKNGACIIGQSGIGKSCFLLYAVVERLRKKQPVAVEYFNQQYWLFTSDGVSFHAGGVPLRPYQGIWAFSDSNDSVTGTMPTASFTDTLGVRTFQVTSPIEAPYDSWTKEAFVNHYYMDLPSQKDIENFSLVVGRNVGHMKHIANKWGPILRRLINVYDNEGWGMEEVYLLTVRSQVYEGLRKIDHILDASRNSIAPRTAAASDVFFIRPYRHEGVVHRGLHEVFLATPFFQHEVVKALHCQKESERCTLYNALVGSSEGRQAIGGVFKMIVHSYITSHSELSIRWYTYNNGKPSPSPSRSRYLSFGQLQALPTNQDPVLARSPFYWCPEEPIFPSIDCAIITKDFIYAIQVTTTASYGFNASGLSKFRDSLGTRRELLKGFLVIGRTEKETDSVARNLISEMKGAGEELVVGSVTLGYEEFSSIDKDYFNKEWRTSRSLDL